ncbi:MAG TPA: hypothetical protein VN765_06565 [Candidatus Acidoferrum sp.]|nr:hypothetical protein [Candidatus Acidoferrum sp.]
MKASNRQPGVGLFELIEQAVHLLRSAPFALLAPYFVGTLPFILAFLYFWADMSRGAFAREHAAGAAAGMGLLFLWMKCWQAVFAAGLRSRITGRAPEPWTVRRGARLALTQSALQPSGLFAVPLALVTVFFFAWVYSFYQNLTAGGGEERSLGETCKTAATQAGLRLGQNLLLLAILFLFAVLVWLNTILAMAALPGLLRTLFGVDSAFTQAGWHGIFNSTYLACSCALTYSFVDPLIKAVFVLRCFYGQSIRSGDDLKAELAGLRPLSPGAPALVASRP